MTDVQKNNVMAKKLAEAYVEPDAIVLDPDKLDKTILDRMPQPTGWRMLVLPYAGKAKTDGGILLTKQTTDRESLATVVAYVVKKGPLCFNDKKRYGDTPWCEEKQWVLIGRYSGSRFKLEDGAEVRIINDDEVIATILNPDDIVSL
mgnify:CR=1 FL=1|jgi:co-chaperonin GroES (HSP10)|tara:strand:+ start:65 stop:505 length:441 start_codon:yes stop_codon:yes gene_type:complete